MKIKPTLRVKNLEKPNKKGKLIMDDKFITILRLYVCIIHYISFIVENGF